MDALAKLKDERGAEAVAAHLTDFGFGRADVVQALCATWGRSRRRPSPPYVNNRTTRASEGGRATAQGLRREGRCDASTPWWPTWTRRTTTSARRRPNGWPPSRWTTPIKSRSPAPWTRWWTAPTLRPGTQGGGQGRGGVGRQGQRAGPDQVHGEENSDIWGDCMEALGRLKDEKAAVPLILQTAKASRTSMRPTGVGDDGARCGNRPGQWPDESRRFGGGKGRGLQLLGGEIGTKTSIPALTAAATDPDPKVKAAAAALSRPCRSATRNRGGERAEAGRRGFPLTSFLISPLRSLLRLDLHDRFRALDRLAATLEDRLDRAVHRTADSSSPESFGPPAPLRCSP